jgi:hypothetical protein
MFLIDLFHFLILRFSVDLFFWSISVIFEFLVIYLHVNFVISYISHRVYHIIIYIVLHELYLVIMLLVNVHYIFLAIRFYSEDYFFVMIAI